MLVCAKVKNQSLCHITPDRAGSHWALILFRRSLILNTVLRMNADECAPSESKGTPTHVDRDLEMDFIREFATGGELLMGLGVDGRRERIRLAIYTQKRAHLLFRDGPMTYAEAYEECFGRPLEMRSSARAEPKSAPVSDGVSAKKAIRR
jgi:hypothetical protein